MATVAAVKDTILSYYNATYVCLAVFSEFPTTNANQSFILTFLSWFDYTVYIVYRLVYRLILYPYLFSPLRSVPGPPLGNPLLGQYPVVLKENPGIPYRKWVKQYGPVLRVTGPIGVERLVFMKPEALQRILVSDWLEYPRVRTLPSPLLLSIRIEGDRNWFG